MDTFRDNVWATIGVIALVIVALVVGIMFFFGFGLFSNATANFRGNVAKNNLTKANGSYRIAKYEHFFNLCAEVQNDESAISALRAQATSDTGEQKAIDKSDITANVIDRATQIHQYNVDAAESYTQGQFLASNLPPRLYTSTRETQCTA